MMEGTLALNGQISGSLAPVSVISGSLTATGGLSVVGGLTVPSVIYPDLPTYDGSYVITPLPFAETILATSDKRMTGDVTVEEIPYYETTNDSGGYTVIIG